MVLLFLFCGILGGLACAASAVMAGYGWWVALAAYSLGGGLTLGLTAGLIMALQMTPVLRK